MGIVDQRGSEKKRNREHLVSTVPLSVRTKRRWVYARKHQCLPRSLDENNERSKSTRTSLARQSRPCKSVISISRDTAGSHRWPLFDHGILFLLTDPATTDSCLAGVVPSGGKPKSPKGENTRHWHHQYHPAVQQQNSNITHNTRFPSIVPSSPTSSHDQHPQPCSPSPS